MSADGNQPPIEIAKVSAVPASDAMAVRRAVQRFHSFSTADAKELLEEVCEVVATGHGRIEITACDAAHRCVIISKQELDDLEHALEILSGTGVAQSARARVARLCASVERADTTAAHYDADA